MMLRGHGDAVIRVSRFPTSSSSSCVPQNAKFTSVHSTIRSQMARKLVTLRTSIVACSSAVQESSTSTALAADENKEVKAAPKPTAAKPKAPAKAPAKSLPQMMEEDIIPSLKSILEAQEYLTNAQVSFQDNRLEGSFVKKGIPYSFWAFFSTGSLTGPKGFSLSSYGLGPSSVEPFLVDEKKITARHVVFWVEKRLAAQGIIPVWNDT